MSDRAKVSWLIAAHAVTGLVSCWWSEVTISAPYGLVHLLIVPFLALALCQGFLIALWVAVGWASPWWRLAALVAGVGYLEGLFNARLRSEFLGLTTVTTLVTTACLLVVRRLGGRLAKASGPAQDDRSETEGMRFSIRSLMAVIGVVAMLSAGARGLQEYRGQFVLISVLWGVCFVVLGLVALWAALGAGRPLARWPVVAVLAAALGIFFGVAVAAHSQGRVYIVLTMLLYQAALVGSLLVVRSCGCRFVRVASLHPAASGGVLEPPIAPDLGVDLL